MKIHFIVLSLVFAGPVSAVSLKKMCQTDYSSPSGKLRPEIVKCGTYYRANYLATDIPSYVLDEKGTVMATCGGMPLPAVGPDGQHSPVLCDSGCDTKNLCTRAK